MYSGSPAPIMRFDHSNSLHAVLLRHAHDLGDRLQRQLRRDVDDEVGLALLDHLVDDVRGAGAQRLLEQPDHARREALVHEQPVTGVLGRVHFEHDHATCRVRLSRSIAHLRRTPAGEDLRAAALRREQRGVTVHREDVVVLHDVPEPVAR